MTQESEDIFVVEKIAKSVTAEMSFRMSESVEVTQIMATEQESKEVIKGVAKEVSAQPDVIKHEVALKTEVQLADVVDEFKVMKPESKIAKDVDEIQQSVIVTEPLSAGEIESEMPESVLPSAKLANIIVEAEHLEHVVGEYYCYQGMRLASTGRTST